MRAETQRHIGGGFDERGQAWAFGAVPFAEHIISLLAGVEVAANAATEAGVVVAAGELIDGFEAVVSSVGAFAAQAELREIEVEVVHHHQQIFFRYFLGL